MCSHYHDRPLLRGHLTRCLEIDLYCSVILGSYLVCAAPLRRGPDRGHAAPLRRGPGRGHAAPLRRGPDRVRAAPLRRGPGRVHAAPLRRGPGRGHAAPLRRGPDRGHAAPLRRGPGRVRAAPLRRGPGRVHAAPLRRGPGRGHAAPLRRGPDRGHAAPLRRGPGRVHAAPLRRGPGRGHAAPLRRGPGRVHAAPLRRGPDRGHAAPLRRGPDRVHAASLRRGPDRVHAASLRRGDGEIEPGNTVEVLFLNNDEGHESYDALDAMVMKVDTDVRPTRYYVHFKDMARRHDRWVTRPEISRVYRSQLLPIQMVEPTSPPASGPSRRKRAPTGSSPEPASRERLPSCECDSQTDPADRPPREASGRAGGSPCRAAAAAALPSPRSGRSTPARRLSFVPELSPPPPAEETGDRPVATGAQ
ncbi:enterin neuropeptides-like isoform X1 [Pollicipes pollicipes]|uniref:enterin neuropeptides-like isoform X1 n=1 Tax=Pollicipes pollicipes TaxID=41117 RepID=UPI001884CADA|nr:enterin neuropeptides-like isoform X1 [Pollicipes pollicipes]